MKKILSLTLATVMSLSAFATLAACGGDDGTKKDGENAAPVITGVKEEAMVFAGEEYDALAGVTASDAEDGDLTSKIEVSASGLTFTNGKVTPTESAEYTGYEIAYTVKDSGGEETTEYGTLYVYEESEALQKKFTADFTTPTLPQDEGDNKPYSDKVMHWWELNVADGAAATESHEKGAFVINVTDGGANAEDITLKRSFGDYVPATYRVDAWVESSAATTIKAKASVETTGYTETKDVALVAGYQKISVEFNVTAEGTAWFEFQLGGADQVAFTLSVLKIDIFRSVGEGEDDVLGEHAFTTSEETANITNDGNAAVSFNDAAKETHIAVTYGNENADWESKATIALNDDVAIVKDVQYKLSLTLKATHALSVNVCVEQSEVDGAFNNRPYFGTVTSAANEEKTFDLTFTAGKSLESGNAVVRLYLGVHEEGLTENDVVIKNFKLVCPTQTVRKAHDNFMLFGWGAACEGNATYPYNVFNGTDDENGPRTGMSAMYIEQGKLFYYIYEGAARQGDNSLQLGFGENTVVLPGNAYYVVTFKIKASAELDFNLTLHDNTFDGDSWDTGLIMRYADFEGTALHVGTTEQTFTLISHAVNAETKCALLFEFGSEKLAALTGGVTIEISELSIGYRTIKTAAAD